MKSKVLIQDNNNFNIGIKWEAKLWKICVHLVVKSILYIIHTVYAYYINHFAHCYAAMFCHFQLISLFVYC